MAQVGTGCTFVHLQCRSYTCGTNTHQNHHFLLQIAVLVDDMIDTAGTITNAAKALHADGAREVYACTSHAVFSPPAIERLSSGVFQEVIVTNSIPVPEVRLERAA
jgi:phosphoribosylpyrophosphate synthetase